MSDYYNVLSHSGLGVTSNSPAAPSEPLDGFFDTVKGFFSQKTDVNKSTGEKVPSAWYQDLINIYGAVQGQRQADKLQKENLERMRQGLQPLSVQQWTANQPPAARIQHEMDQGTKQILIYGGVGLGALLLFSLMRKR